MRIAAILCLVLALSGCRSLDSVAGLFAEYSEETGEYQETGLQKKTKDLGKVLVLFGVPEGAAIAGVAATALGVLSAGSAAYLKKRRKALDKAGQNKSINSS